MKDSYFWVMSIFKYSGTSISQNSREIQFFGLIEVFDLLRFLSYQGFRKKIEL